MLFCRMAFELESNYKPRGDQGQAIAKLLKSIEAGNRHQTLLGVTGSGKTFTMANVIRELDRPALIISHNKTLAAQLYSEFKQFFPRNAVEYFVSYFDYYQPEAYIPRSDTYIEKDSSINEEIERLRLVRDQRAALAAGHDRGGERFLHLRRDLAGRLSAHATDGEKRAADQPRSGARPARRHALRAQRHEFFARQIPGPRRRGRGLSRDRG